MPTPTFTRTLEFDAFFDDGVLPFAEEGNVISAAFTAVGVIVKEEET